MPYMTEMDRLEMCCIFLLEGLRRSRGGDWCQAGPHRRSPCALGSLCHHTLTIWQLGKSPSCPQSLLRAATEIFD